MALRITELLYAPSRRITIAITSDGGNYALPAIRKPSLVAKFCRLVRDGLWELSATQEGVDAMLAAPDLERQKLSF